MSVETDVREAAVKLHEAIVAAIEAGYRVPWPSSPDGLPAIAVSETARVNTTLPPGERERVVVGEAGPATFGTPKPV